MKARVTFAKISFPLVDQCVSLSCLKCLNTQYQRISTRWESKFIYLSLKPATLCLVVIGSNRHFFSGSDNQLGNLIHPLGHSHKHVEQFLGPLGIVLCFARDPASSSLTALGPSNLQLISGHLQDQHQALSICSDRLIKHSELLVFLYGIRSTAGIFPSSSSTVDSCVHYCTAQKANASLPLGHLDSNNGPGW